MATNAMYDKENNIYDCVEIEDLDFEEDDQAFYYPCPCGDRFTITVQQILKGKDIAKCPSCSLKIKVIYDMDYVKEKFSDLIMSSI